MQRFILALVTLSACSQPIQQPTDTTNNQDVVQTVDATDVITTEDQPETSFDVGCMPPMMMCGNACVDLQNDQFNCGMCFGFCSNACINGHCTVDVIDTGNPIVDACTKPEYYDRDSDGYGAGKILRMVPCDYQGQPGLTAFTNTDCNDNNPEIHPGHLDWCDGIDSNCDGIADNNPQNTLEFNDAGLAVIRHDPNNPWLGNEHQLCGVSISNQAILGRYICAYQNHPWQQSFDNVNRVVCMQCTPNPQEINGRECWCWTGDLRDGGTQTRCNAFWP